MFLRFSIGFPTKMGQSDDIEDSTYSRHQDLCQKLNMDATSASEAWKSYETIRQNYTLEVLFELLHFRGGFKPHLIIWISCDSISLFLMLTTVLLFVILFLASYWIIWLFCAMFDIVEFAVHFGVTIKAHEFKIY